MLASRSVLPFFGAATVSCGLTLGCDLGLSTPNETEGDERIAEQVEAPVFVALSPSVATPQPTKGQARSTTSNARPRAPAVQPDAGAVEAKLEGREETAKPSQETRIARRLLEVRAAPDPAAPLRGRIPMAAAFEVFGRVEGHKCDGLGWADVGNGGYVCLEHTRPAPADREARALPRLRVDDLVPYHYAKVDKGATARRWRSVADLERGAPHLDVLQPGHDYAFVGRRRRAGQIVLVDARGRAVLEREVQRHRPSPFAGRDLELDPLPAGKALAWTVTWPDNPVLAEPDPAAPVVTSLDYHLELVVDAADVDAAWVRVAGGWLHERHVRRFRPVPPPADVSDAEIWIDVDLEEQTLAVVRGSTPIFATLISAGFKGPTPRGLFRIHHKQAIGDMSSSPGSDQPYTVEAIPFVQYFVGGYALHSAYWHNRFGHPISHGCVNLSPRDARTVFGLTGPHVPGGWVHGYETEADPGTTVRIRRGTRPVEDKRRAAEPVF